MITRLARWWLERAGHYVVMRWSIQIVISGNFLAEQKEDGNYIVVPPFPDARIVALNNSVALLNAKSRGREDAVIIEKVGENGVTTYAWQ